MSYRAVVFDLWDTLALWPVDDGRAFHDRMAEHVGIAKERFAEAWVAAYDQRATGPLEPSIRSVCAQLGVPEERLETLIRARVDFTREVLVPRTGSVDARFWRVLASATVPRARYPGDPEHGAETNSCPHRPTL